jgi:hypothetical protein
LEAFENFLKWFGPIEGAEVLDQLKNLLEQKWFHGELSAQEAEQKLLSAKKGSYLVRFSSTGGFTISFVDKKQKLLHFRVPEKARYDLQKYVRLFAKKQGLEKPVKGPFTHLFRSPKEQNQKRGYMNEYEEGQDDDQTPITQSTVTFIA